MQLIICLLLYFDRIAWRKKNRSGNKNDALPQEMGSFFFVHHSYRASIDIAHATRWCTNSLENSVDAIAVIRIEPREPWLKTAATYAIQLFQFNSIQYGKKKRMPSFVWQKRRRSTGRHVYAVILNSLECFQELPHQHFIGQRHAIGGHFVCVCVFIAVCCR